MRRSEWRLWGLAAAAWLGAAVGGALPAPGGAPGWALAAALVLLLASRAPPHRRAALAGLAVALALAALGSSSSAEPPPRAQGRVEGRLLELRAARGGLSLRIATPRGVRRLFVPATGRPSLDRAPPAAVPGARVSVLAARPGMAAAAAAIVVRAPAPGLAPTAAAHRLRARFRGRVGRRLGGAGAAAGLLRAAVAGDRDALPPETLEHLRASGLAHVAVVSGLHTGLVVTAAALLLALSGGARREAVALLTVLALLILLPPAPPVRRAAAALLAALAGRACGRASGAGAALGTALLFLLALEPRLALDGSFALTATATASLLLARSRGSRLWMLAAPSFATQPLILGLAGRWAPWAVAANLAALPLVPPLLVLGWLALLLPPAPAALARAAALALARGLLRLAAVVADWPGSGRLAPPLAAIWVILAESGLALGLAARRRHLRRAGFGLLAATLAWAACPSGGRAGRPRLELLDVGEGQAILLRGGRRHAVLIDTGPPRLGARGLLSQLRRRRVTRLAGLVLTHGDADHTGNAHTLLRATRPAFLAFPEQLAGRKPLRTLTGVAARLGTAARPLAAGDRLDLAGFEALVLHPGPGETRADNESCLVLALRGGGLSALVTSDLGVAVEHQLARAGRLPVADLLVVGHHGSRRSTSGALLDAVRPRLALISTGHRFGHPHPETLRRLRRRSIRLLSTARAGPVAARLRKARLIAIGLRGAQDDR